MAMQGIIQDVTSLFQKYLLDLHLRVKVQLRAKNVSDEAITCLDPLFSPVGKYGQPFKGLDTEYFQLKYFRKHFSMAVRTLTLWHVQTVIIVIQDPQTIVLGSEQKMRGSAEKRRCVEVKHEMKYIPLLFTLERLLQNKNLLSEVYRQLSYMMYLLCMFCCSMQINTGHKSEDSVLRDYVDGKVCTNHPLISINSQWLQV